MKEIDALLLRYLDQAGATVPLASMDALLETQDDVLWQWLLGRQVPDDAALAELIACIRSAAQASEH